jgi:hypothetical protein
VRMSRNLMGAGRCGRILCHPAFSTVLPGVALTAALLFSTFGGNRLLAQPAADQSGAGPQILTADLLLRQEVRADKIIANWAIVGNDTIKSVTINGEPQTFAPGDTVSISKEFILKIAQTIITIAAVDTKGEKRELSYLIVNPGLSVKEPEFVAAPSKIAETKEEQKKQEAEIEKQEEIAKAKYSESDFTGWYYPGALNQVYNREIRRGMYPVWMESRNSGGSQYRIVFKPLPTDVLTHRAYWGLTPQQYNNLVDDLSLRGYQQVFREVMTSGSTQWQIQTVWVLKAGKH